MFLFVCFSFFHFLFVSLLFVSFLPFSLVKMESRLSSLDVRRLAIESHLDESRVST